jgi:Leucine-rich repeat (LRR) protein
VADLFGGDFVQKPASPVPRLAPRPVIKKAAPAPVVAIEENTPSPKAATAAKSSLALREQIRAAKAARLSSSKQDMQSKPISDFDPKHFKDPFNTKPKDERSLIRQRVDSARSDGRLNVSAMGLKDIPEEVLRMYDYEYNKDTDVQWNEVVDLTRFIAADNEIETIPDAVFPDVDGNSFSENDDAATPKFGGLEILDLHGNNLFDVPTGLRRLECLTSLNLVCPLSPTPYLRRVLTLRSHATAS